MLGSLPDHKDKQFKQNHALNFPIIYYTKQERFIQIFLNQKWNENPEYT